MYLSIVIPCYNEEKRIPATLSKIEEYLSQQKYDYEILVIDDGSKDRTREIVLEMQKKIPTISLLRLEQNSGKGASVRAGMLAARGEYTLFLDADHSVSIDHLEQFLPYVSQGYDIVIGSIEVPGASVSEHAGPQRRFLGKIAKHITRTMLPLEIEDTQRGFKLFSCSAKDTLFPNQKIQGFGFDMEILFLAKKHGFRVKELPVQWNNAAGSSVTWRSYLEAFRDILEIRASQSNTGVRKEIPRFAFVGVLNTTVDFLILNLLIYFAGLPSSARFSFYKIISFLGASTNSFFWNKHFVFFKEKQNARTQKKIKEPITFFFITTLSFVANLSVATSCFSVLSSSGIFSSTLSANIASMAGTGAGLFLNFFGYKFLVFKK